MMFVLFFALGMHKKLMKIVKQKYPNASCLKENAPADQEQAPAPIPSLVSAPPATPVSNAGVQQVNIQQL